MRILSEEKRQSLLDSLAVDPRFLGRLRNSRIKEYEEETIEKFELETYQKDGFEAVPSRLKKKIKVRKYKKHDVAFENKCWCLMYDLGFRVLNKNSNFILPYGRNEGESQQIDVIAVNDDVVILIECKSSQNITRKDHRPYIDTLGKKISGFTQVIKELFGERRVKFIFATNNQKLGDTNIEILKNNRVFYLNNSSQDYIRGLIDSYKYSAHYQFMGMLFKGEIINPNKLRIPAIKGKMGGNNYYLFSIEPEILLKIGFVLHRVKANAEDFPTYQRLLKKDRIKSLSQFINEGGYFPNSVIINFDTVGVKNPRKLEWEDAGQRDDSLSDHGILKIPNSYGIAYIIDGQHRVYGYSYAEPEFKTKQTIPVVAFENLSNEKQLQMFIDINENQKAISRDLKETLKEDIWWMSDKPNLKIEALISGINNFMGSENGYKISKYLSVGEDKKEITMGYIIDGIKDSGFLPKVEKGEMIDSVGVLYKIGVSDHYKEMNRLKSLLGNFLSKAFDYVIDNYPDLWNIKGGLIRSPRGAYAFIRTLGELNQFLTNKKIVHKDDTGDVRLDAMRKYLDVLFIGLNDTQKDTTEYDRVLSSYGGRNKKIWNHLYTSIINRSFSDFTTPDYEIYLETQDDKIQAEANKLIEDIEKIIKERTLTYIYAQCGGEENFRKEYYQLFSELRKRAEEKEIEYQKNFEGSEKSYKWSEMFDILDYLKLAEKGWGKPLENKNLKRLSEVLSMRWEKVSYDPETKTSYYSCGNEPAFNTGSKWIKKFNIIRSNSAHSGSRNKGNGVNKTELEHLKLIYNGLIRISD